MEYTEDFLKKIVGVGTLGYSVSKIINALDIEEKDMEQFVNDFDDFDSPLRRAYQKGVDKADYAIDTKLFEQAKAGDLKSLQKYEERKNQQLQKEKAGRENKVPCERIRTARTGEQKGKCAIPCVGFCVLAAWLFCPVRWGSVGSTFYITINSLAKAGQISSVSR